MANNSLKLSKKKASLARLAARAAVRVYGIIYCGCGCGKPFNEHYYYNYFMNKRNKKH